LLTGLSILVAEDNSLNQRIVNFILQKQHAEVVAVVNGSDAVEQVRNKDFDVILMDLQMPEMDGYEATSYIRQTLKKTVPVIAMSASNFEEDIKKCMQVGMNTCISKPFEPADLCELILKVLRDQKTTT